MMFFPSARVKNEADLNLHRVLDHRRNSALLFCTEYNVPIVSRLAFISYVCM